jgi:hypothetical protein
MDQILTGLLGPLMAVELLVVLILNELPEPGRQRVKQSLRQFLAVQQVQPPGRRRGPRCGRSSMWKVGQVMSVGVGDGAFGYGFNVTTSRNQPLVLFAYETREAAEAAAQQIEAAVERAVLVRPFPV